MPYIETLVMVKRAVADYREVQSAARFFIWETTYENDPSIAYWNQLTFLFES